MLGEPLILLASTPHVLPMPNKSTQYAQRLNMMRLRKAMGYMPQTNNTAYANSKNFAAKHFSTFLVTVIQQTLKCR